MDRISALMDGELDERDGEREIARLKTDEALRRVWDEYHIVRDALTGEPLLSAGFSASLSKRLAEEPTVLAPRRMAGKARRVTTYALSAAASLSAAALVAWVAISPAPPVAGPMAAAPAAPVSLVPAASESAVAPVASVPSDGRMNSYLMAHDFSLSSSMHGVAPYIRTVSAIRASDRR